MAGTKETIARIQMNKTAKHKGKLDNKIHENLILTFTILQDLKLNFNSEMMLMQAKSIGFKLLRLFKSHLNGMKKNVNKNIVYRSIHFWHNFNLKMLHGFHSYRSRNL